VVLDEEFPPVWFEDDELEEFPLEELELLDALLELEELDDVPLELLDGQSELEAPLEEEFPLEDFPSEDLLSDDEFTPDDDLLSEEDEQSSELDE
jgi:hypothetical protein